ncbi:MAG: VanZ family protein [Spirochaetes bacterium]|nr:VanZ family protein [Spirochaetota bacterium]
MDTKRVLIAINIAILCTIITVGMWPFDFHPKNKISRSPDGQGIVFRSNSLVCEHPATTDPGLLNSLIDPEEMTIEFMVKPLIEANANISAMVTFYDSTDPEIFLIGQWKSSLLLRIRSSQSGNNFSYQERGVPNVFFPGRLSMITLSMNGSGTAVYLDGSRRAFLPDYHLRTDRRSLRNARLVLGNNPAIQYPMDGGLYGLALFNRALSPTEVKKHFGFWNSHDYENLRTSNGIIALYPLNEKAGPDIRNIVNSRNNMVIPDSLFAIKKIVLGRPWARFWKSAHFYYDILINILGFVILGFFLITLIASYTGISSVKYTLLSILIGAGMSFAIELVQVFMPARTSSITDLLCNTIGTVIGVLIFHRIYKSYPNIIKKPG